MNTSCSRISTPFSEFYQNHGYIDVEVKDVRKERGDGGPITDDDRD